MKTRRLIRNHDGGVNPRDTRVRLLLVATLIGFVGVVAIAPGPAGAHSTALRRSKSAVRGGGAQESAIRETAPSIPSIANASRHQKRPVGQKKHSSVSNQSDTAAQSLANSNASNVNVGIQPSTDSAGYAFYQDQSSLTVTTTFVEPRITCTGESEGESSSLDLGILASVNTGQGQSTIYAQNFCLSSNPNYRFDLEVPGVSYDPYGYGSANPGDTITLTDDIGASGTSVTFDDVTDGSTQTVTGDGASVTGLQIGALVPVGYALAGFNPVHFTDVTLNGGPLSGQPDLDQVNLVVGSTIGIETSNLDGTGSGFTLTYDLIPGPTVTGISPTTGPAAGGTGITIQGTGFGQPGDNVAVNLAPQSGGSDLPATDITVVNSTTITATTADAAAQFTSGQTILPSDVEVNAGGVTSGPSPADVFTYVDETQPILSIGNVTISGPFQGTVTANVPVTLNGALDTPVSFTYATADGTALQGADYTKATGLGTIATGQTSTTIPITILTNLNATGNRDFTVSITGVVSPSNVSVLSPTATVEITDTAPSLSVSNVTVKRPSKGKADASFVVSLSGPSPTTIKADYATANGSATSPIDYLAKSGHLTFTPNGPTTQTVNVKVVPNPSGTIGATFALTITGVTPASVVVQNSGLATLTQGFLLMESDRTTVWGNGHDSATITVTTNDGNGNSVVGQKIDLTANPSPGVNIQPAHTGSDVTNASGQATFTVTSDGPIDPNSQSPDTVTLTATSTGSSFEAPGTVDLTFIRHKVVVQFLGITTNLSCSGGNSSTCTDPDAGTPTPSDVFGQLRLSETQSGFQPTDFLWYSYNGGTVDHTTGEWLPNSYSCSDTAQSYNADIAQLAKLIRTYSKANPNTDFYLVAHSQGGLIAFQQLALSDLSSSSDRIEAVITLDSPLGGVPLTAAGISSLGSCWKGKAPYQLGTYFGQLTGNQANAAGDNNEVLCAFVGACPSFTGVTNAAVATRAEGDGTSVFTYGSSQDAVYAPVWCLLPPLYSVASTEVVSTATAGGLSPFDNDVGGLPICVHNSHVSVIPNEQQNIMQIIGLQDQ